MKKMRTFSIALLLVLSVLFAGCSPKNEAASKATNSTAGDKKASDPKFISLAGGSVGGGWYVLCGVISEMLTPEFPDTNIKVVTGGSISNPTTVSTGKVEIATTQDNIYADAIAGTGAYKDEGAYKDVTGLLRLGSIYMSVFLVEKGSKYESIKQIIDNKMPVRIVTAVQAASPALATNRVLEAYGVTPETITEWGGSVTYVSYSEATALMKDGHADVYCGPIMPATLELAVSKDLKPLPLDADIIDKLQKTYKYGKSTIPAGKYDFIAKDLDVITENPVLIISSRLSDDIVYRITKTICENPEKIQNASKTYSTWTPELAPDMTGGPIHPGAMKYYKEMGLVK